MNVTPRQIRAIANAHAASIRKPTLPSPQVGAVTVEPTSGHWTGNTEWGKQFTGDYPQSLDSVISVLNNDALPGPPRAVSITLFRSEPEGQEVTNAEIRCEVIYGSGGVSNTILVDWAYGASFMLPANTIRVNARGYAPLGNSPYNGTLNAPGIGPAKTQLGVTIGIDGTSPTVPVTFTSPIFTLAAGTSIGVFVPEFAKRAIPYIGRTIFAPIVPANFLMTSLGKVVIPLQSYLISDQMLLAGVPLAAQCQQIVIANNSPDLCRAGVIFELGL